MEARSQTPSRSFSIALALVALITPLAVHIFLPVIPAVKAALNLSEAWAQLMFSTSLFTMAFATLVYGTLSDRLGRRPVLMSGLVLFLIGSLVSLVAQTATVLVIGRLIQAVGAACGMTLVRTIARDAFRAEHLVRAIAYLTMFYTLGPMVSPLIGGVLIDTLGWRSVFGFGLIAGGVIAVTAFLAVHETRPQTIAGAGDAGILSGYAALFRKPDFTAFVLQSGFNTGCFMTMASASASLMKELLQRPSTEFGLYFLLFPIGFFLGTFVSSRLGNRAANETMVLVGSALALATVSIQAVVLLHGTVTPLSFFVPGFFLTMAQGIALPYAQVGAMGAIPRLAGTASGVGVFMQHFFGAVFAQLYGVFADGTPAPMVLIVMLGAVLCFASGAVPFARKRLAARQSTPA